MKPAPRMLLPCCRPSCREKCAPASTSCEAPPHTASPNNLGHELQKLGLKTRLPLQGQCCCAKASGPRATSRIAPARSALLARSCLPYPAFQAFAGSFTSCDGLPDCFKLGCGTGEGIFPEVFRCRLSCLRFFGGRQKFMPWKFLSRSR